MLPYFNSTVRVAQAQESLRLRARRAFEKILRGSLPPSRFDMAQHPDVPFVGGYRLTFVFPILLGLRHVVKSSAVSFGMISSPRASLRYNEILKQKD